MLEQENILITGGSGLLGRQLRLRLPAARFPSSSEFDVTDFAGMEAFVAERAPAAVVHAAAFTSPPKVDQDPVQALETNIVGTANVVKLCAALGSRLVYLSTDYVFSGDRGNYREHDPVHPVNKYAWSKLGGECCVRMYDRSLILRTSFGPNVFPYPKAFSDQWTSRESVSAIAEKIAALLRREDFESISGVLHLGGPRRTVLEYARSLDPEQEVGALSIEDVSFEVPRDTSLDCALFDRLFASDSN